MPTGIYERTKEYKARRKGRIPWNKGKTGLHSSWNKQVLNPDGSQTCKKCGESKHLSEFGNNASSLTGKSCYCKPCRMKREHERKLADPSQYREEKKRHYLKYRDGYRSRQLKRQFGIDLNRYNEMFAEQEGKCKSCGTHQKDLRLGLSVDHCHKTGKVRGLLCGNCNTALGLLKDDPVLIEKLLTYLADSAQLGVVSA